MTRWIAFLPLTIAACAPSATPGPAPASRGASVETMQVQNEIRGVRLTREGTIAPQTVPLPRDRAMAGLRAAYDSIGLPVAQEDAAAGTLSTGNFTVNGRLGNIRLSRLLSCGTQRGLENADSYEVVMVVSSQVTAAGDAQSSVSTSVQGWAAPRGTAGSNRLTCSSTGQLEGRLAQLVTMGGA